MAPSARRARIVRGLSSLLDFGARMYRPSAGAFTQLDTYAGGAQNPLSMNRFIHQRRRLLGGAH